MIYHTFPKVTTKDKYAHQDVISGYMPAIDTIISTYETLEKLKLKSFVNNPYFEVVVAGKIYKYPVDPDIRQLLQPDYQQIESYAKRWSNAAIVKVDTLRELEQWIPFGKLHNEFPIYKFYFNDVDKHQLYVSSQTGEALQFTDKNNRFWAWLGAIPHWIYFTSLRQNSQLWADVVIWLSGIGCIMCIAGMILGIRSYIVYSRRAKKWKTPYKKFVYKWHHILGFVFGIFVFTYVFSGMMSLVTVPHWMVKVHTPDLQKKLFVADPVILADYKLDYRDILEIYEGKVKSIEWASFGQKPLYKVVIDNRLLTVDASGDSFELLKLDEEAIRENLSRIYTEPIRISLLTEYDNYYASRKGQLPLPIYKAEISDADNSTYYINPENGNIQYFNSNSKVHRWTYQALHSFTIKWLLDKPVLWNIVIWVTMIGGTLVSGTGVWLSVRYIRRKVLSIRKK